MKLFITVLDLNEYKPVFEEKNEIDVFISENIPVGDVVATLKATDGDIGSNVSLNILKHIFKQFVG